MKLVRKNISPCALSLVPCQRSRFVGAPLGIPDLITKKELCRAYQCMAPSRILTLCLIDPAQ